MAILTPEPVLSADSIPFELPSVPATSSLHAARDSAERAHILRALEDNGWNVSAAARALGMERTNLHKRIRAPGLKR